MTRKSGAWATNAVARYVYDRDLVLQERDRWNVPQVTYTRGADLSGRKQGAGGIGGLLARHDHPSRTAAYYHADGSGNVSALIDAQNRVMARYLYDPFGNLLSQAGPLAEANRQRFSSKEYHPGSGLYHFGRRSYDPGLQRWTSRDPLDVAGGLNLYAFAGNDPVNRIDPWGLFGDSVLDCATRDGHITRAADLYRCDEDVQDTLMEVLGPMIDPSPEVMCDWLRRLGEGLNLQEHLSLHNILATLGMIEGVGTFADLLDAAIYAAEGDFEGANLALTATIPVIGMASGPARLARTGAETGREIVQRAMSRAELEAIEKTGLLRGGREGTHYVSDAVNSDPLRARQRLALPQTPQVRATLEVPGGRFSPPSRVPPDYGMSGGGMQRTASGTVPVRVVRVEPY